MKDQKGSTIIQALDTRIKQVKLVQQDQNTTALEKEEVFEFVKRIEEQKCNAMAQIQIAVDQKKVAPKDAPFIVEVNRLRILD